MKISIYAGQPIQAVLEGHADNRSGRLNTICERYADIVRRDCPMLTEAEWCAICDALNGYWMDAGDTLGVRFAWAELLDCEGLGEKWGVDVPTLAARLRESGAGAQVAVAEVVQRFWQHADLPRRDALHRAGARLVDAPEVVG